MATLLAALLIGVGYEQMFRSDHRGCAWSYLPTSFARRVMVQRWFRLSLEDLLAYGTCTGERLALETAVARCLRFPSAAINACVDGVGHGFDPALGQEEEVAAALSRLGPDQRPLLRDGLVRGWTVQARGAPELVLPRIAALEPEANGYANGVRIGIQVGQGDDLPVALAVGSSWPEPYQTPIFEELGWRAGNDDPQHPFAYLESVPEAARPAFIQGVARGAALQVSDGRSPDETVAAINDLLRGLELQRPRESAHIRLGAAMAMLLRYDAGPERVDVLRRVGLQSVVALREKSPAVPIWAGPEAGTLVDTAPNIIH